MVGGKGILCHMSRGFLLLEFHNADVDDSGCTHLLCVTGQVWDLGQTLLLLQSINIRCRGKFLVG